jgi:hypothetical protein
MRRSLLDRNLLSNKCFFQEVSKGGGGTRKMRQIGMIPDKTMDFRLMYYLKFLERDKNPHHWARLVELISMCFLLLVVD